MLTLHDLYPFEIPRNFRLPHVVFNRLILQQRLRKVDAVACVSDSTMALLGHYVPSLWRRAVRIYNCVEREPQYTSQLPIPRWHSEPLLLSIAQHRRNKTLPLLIQTFCRLLRKREIDPNMKLLVVGIAGPETRNIHMLIFKLRLSRSIQLLHGLSGSELQWC